MERPARRQTQWRARELARARRALLSTERAHRFLAVAALKRYRAATVSTYVVKFVLKMAELSRPLQSRDRKGAVGVLSAQ